MIYMYMTCITLFLAFGYEISNYHGINFDDAGYTDMVINLHSHFRMWVVCKFIVSARKNSDTFLLSGTILKTMNKAPHSIIRSGCSGFFLGQNILLKNANSVQFVVFISK